MAKAKEPATKGKVAARSQPIAIALKASPEWKAWADALAEANRAPLSVTIEQALILLAERLGRPGPPPRY